MTKPMKSKPGRNDRCPCGSGRKYKRCCGWKPAAPPKPERPKFERDPRAAAVLLGLQTLAKGG